MAEELLSTNNVISKTPGGTGYNGIPITEFIINGFFTIDPKWTVRYWNNAAEKLMGVKAKDIIGKNLWEYFAGTIPLEFYTVYHKAFIQDIPFHFQEYWAEKGSWFDVITYYDDNVLSVSFKSSNPAPHEEHLLKQDQQLHILTELYRYVTEVTNDCLWEWDLVNKELFWIDGGHKRIFGYHIENALIPQSFWESRIHPDDKERVLNKLNTFIKKASDTSWEIEYRFKMSDGKYAHVHDRGHPIYKDEKLSRMIGATQDITARKQVEFQLIDSERKLSLIARQTVNAVVITDDKERITWVNEAFTRITGYEAEEVIGKKPGSFLQGKETDQATIAYMREKVKAKEAFDCEIINYTKSGKKYWMHVQGQALLDSDGNCERYFAIQTDITEKILLQNILADEKLLHQQEITEAVLTAQENERADIGKELHDNVNQILGATKLYIEMAKTDEEHRSIFLEKSSGYILNVIEEIRRISKTLLPPSMHFMNLFESIKILIEDITAIHPIAIDFNKENIAN